MEFHKQLNEDQMNMLLAKKNSENPLWLSLACEELRLFGVYRQLTQKIQSLADGLLELEIQLLGRFEQENGGDLLIATLCLLECACTGLLETELKEILGNRETLIPHSLMIEQRDNTRPSKKLLPTLGNKGTGKVKFFHLGLKYFVYT